MNSVLKVEMGQLDLLWNSHLGEVKVEREERAKVVKKREEREA